LNRLPAAVPRICDAALDFLVLAFGAWTVVYHVCLVLRIGSLWAAIAEAVALVACALFVHRYRVVPPSGNEVAAGWWHDRRLAVLAAVQVALGLVAAALFGLTEAPWQAVWVFWVLAAGAAVVLTSMLPAASPAGAPPTESGTPDWPSAAIALAWAAGLAVLSLFLVRSAEDDTYYVHLAAWVAEHGVFPIRDSLFSDQRFPAIIYPPLSSFEGAVGTIARGTGISVPNLVYYVVAPLASALSVLAVWRLCRAWRLPLVGIALSVAMLFLLMDASTHRALGNTIIARSWHGKVILVAVLLPLLYALLQEYVERPTGRGLVLLAAAGAAGVGLSSTGAFVVPVVAAGCLLPFVRRAPRQAGAGFVAAAGYPLGAGLLTLAVGGRTPETNPYVPPGQLAHYVLADGMLALIGVAAVLVAPILVPRLAPARMTAGTALLVGLMLTPVVTRALYDATGLGRVLWRLTWALPVAALVGALAVGLSPWIRPSVLKVLPAVVLCAAFLAYGTPSWSGGGISLASSPSWKRLPETVTEARFVLSHARPGDVVLAPTQTSQTIATMSGDVYTVAPRVFYALALEDDPGGHARERVLLGAFADNGLEGPIPRTSKAPTADQVTRALRDVKVDLACIAENQAAEDVLRGAGYTPVGSDGAVTCMRAPAKSER
jgi:hypothetical protein